MTHHARRGKIPAIHSLPLCHILRSCVSARLSHRHQRRGLALQLGRPWESTHRKGGAAVAIPGVADKNIQPTLFSGAPWVLRGPPTGDFLAAVCDHCILPGSAMGRCRAVSRRAAWAKWDIAKPLRWTLLAGRAGGQAGGGRAGGEAGYKKAGTPWSSFDAGKSTARPWLCRRCWRLESLGASRPHVDRARPGRSPRESTLLSLWASSTKDALLPHLLPAAALEPGHRPGPAGYRVHHPGDH